MFVGEVMKKIDCLINNLRGKIKAYFSEENTGHNIDHLTRVMNYALYLQKIEGGDEIVIGISAYIHDIHRIMTAESGKYVSPKESLSKVNEFIEDLDLSDEQKKHILHAVEHHEEYAFGKEKTSVCDIESLILQDADNLDMCGAMGIVRAFKYGFQNNMKDYDPNVELYHDEFSESKNDASTIHHIHNKLLRLAENMNTETAKQLARKKTALMKSFIEMYIEEAAGDVGTSYHSNKNLTSR